MSLFDDFERVGHATPCPVCQHTDWCLVARDGSAALCQRVESASRWKDAGWFHRLRESNSRRPPERPRSAAVGRARLEKYNFRALAAAHRVHYGDRLELFAESLGVSVDSLIRLRIAILDDCSWFPMCDAEARIVGIRVRDRFGKRALTGSQQGIFIPEDLPEDLTHHLLLLPEGPTDAAAMLDLGFHAVGRPSCNGSRLELLRFARRRKCTRVVVVADGDAPGQNGARLLLPLLRAVCKSVKVVTPPNGIKDARDWKRSGATRDDVQRAIDAAPEVGLRVSLVEVSR